MITKIKNGRIVMKSGVMENLFLYIENGVIKTITDEKLPFDTEIDADGNYISAGFIDVHVHGGGGCDFMDGTAEAIVTAANYHLSHGTTAIVPTALASSTETLCGFLENMRSVMTTKSTIMGAHVEGPYFSHLQAGAQNPLYIRNPAPQEYLPILKKYGDIIMRWGFAPELDGAEEFCRALISCGVAPVIAHSNAVYNDVKRVYDIGCRAVAHLYSGMSSITRENGYRRLGVVESAYMLDDMTVEVIADGKHLPPELLQLILKGKTKEQICLITDAMRAAGTSVTETLLGPMHEAVPCIVEDGVAKLPDRTSFAGSIATADRLVRTMVKEVGVSVADAVYMMTVVPARMLGLKNKGKIESGRDADLVFFDDNINIKKVFVGGTEYGNQNM